MKAGTLSVIEPTDSLLETDISGYKPWFEVKKTQETVDGTPIQSGIAVGSKTTEITVWERAVSTDGDDQSLVEMKEEQGEQVPSEWIADPTGTGILAASSTADTGNFYEFPFNIIWSQTGQDPQPVYIDIAELHRDWRQRGAILKQWNVSHKSDESVDILYHDSADDSQKDANIGLGFSRRFDGGSVRGVVFSSGYVALYSVHNAPQFVRFVDEHIMPFADVDSSVATGMQQQLGVAESDGGQSAEEQAADYVDSEEDRRALEDLVEAIVDEYDPDGPTSLAVVCDHMADKHDLNAQELEDRVRHELGMEVDHDG